jgi:pimeloyl-ACP methyl ester carboxylesterase
VIIASNGPTVLDEMNDAGSYATDYGLENVRTRTLLTQGSNSPPYFGRILTQVAAGVRDSKRFTFEGADHNPQMTHPAEFVAKATRWALGS